MKDIIPVLYVEQRHWSTLIHVPLYCTISLPSRLLVHLIEKFPLFIIDPLHGIYALTIAVHPSRYLYIYTK